MGTTGTRTRTRSRTRTRAARRLGTATLAGAILVAGFLGGGHAGADAAFLCGTAPSVDPVAGLDPGPDNTLGTLDDPQGRLVFEYTTDAPGTVGGFTDGQRWTFLPHSDWTVGIDGGPLLTASKELKFVETTLVGAISPTATTITVPSGDFPKFPTTFPFDVAVNAPPAQVEIMHVTGSPGLGQFTVVRGWAVTPAIAYGGGELIRMAGGGTNGPSWSNDARFDLAVRGFLYSNAAYDGTVTQWPAGGPALPNIYPWNAHPLYPPLFQPKGYKTGFGFMSEWSYLEDLLLAGEAALPPVDAMNPVYRPFTPNTPYSGGGTDYGHPWPVIPIESAGFSMPYNDVALKLSFEQLFGVTGGGPTDPASAHPMPQAWFRYRIEIPVVRDSGASDTLDVNLGDDTFEVGAPVTRSVTLSDASTTTWTTYWPDEARTTFYFKMRENELYTNPFPANTAGSPNGLLAAGGETLVKDNLGVAQLQPWPALRLRAQLNDTKIALGYRTTTGTVGFPGTVEVALRHQCDTDDGSEWLAAGHDQAIAGGTPDEMRLRVVSESADVATVDHTTIDFTMEAVPDLVTAKLRSYDDGVNPNQAVDVSGDGANDTFANDQIQFRRSTTAVPRLHGVFLRHTTDLLNVPIDVMSLTADAAALPEHLRLDMTGEVVLVGPGDADRTMHALDARTCGDVWGGGGCTPAPSGTLQFRYVTSPDQLPAVDTGALEQPTYLEQYEAMPANPAPSLATTAPQHFPLPAATDDFVQMTNDVVGATSVASGTVNDVFHVNFDKNPVTGAVDLATNAVGGQPLVFRYLKDEDHGPWPLAPGLQNRRQDVWAALEALPADVALGLDTQNSPQVVDWAVSDRTDAAVAADLHTSPNLPVTEGADMRVVGWIGREAGYTGGPSGSLGLTSTGSLTLDLPTSATGTVDLVGVPGEGMRVDVGVERSSIQALPFVAYGWATQVHGRLTIPEEAHVTWTPGTPSGLDHAELHTCPACGSIEDVEARLDRAPATGAPGWGALTNPWTSLPAVPAPSLSATAPQHFSLPNPATVDFLRFDSVDNNTSPQSTLAGAKLAALHDLVYDRNPGTGVVQVQASAPPGGQPVGLAMHRDQVNTPWWAGGPNPSRDTDVWAVLRELPASLELTLDLENNPGQILWNNSAQTDVALALHLYTSPVASPPANGSRIRAAGWVDREAGYTGSGTGSLGLAPSGTITLDLPGSGQHEIHAVTSQMMRFDVGMTYAKLFPAPFVGDTPSRTTDLRARITVPQDVAVTWTPLVGGGLQKAAVTTSAGPVPDAEGIVTSTDPGLGATGYGALTTPFLAMPAAPPDLVTTQPGYFDPAPVTPASDQQHLQFHQNVDAQSDTAAFHLFDLDGASYEKLTDGAVKVIADVTGGRKTGLYTLRYDSLGSLSNAWAMLAQLPTHLQMVLDTRDVPEDADPIRVDWGLAQRSGAALAVVQLDLNTYDAIRMSGWLGTGTGTADGLPASGFVTYTRAETQNLPVPAQPTRTLDAVWQVSEPMQVKVGVATSNDWIAGLFGARQWADRGIVTALIPEHIDVHYRSGPDPDQTTKGRLERLVVDTCYRKPIIADDPTDDHEKLLPGVDPKLVVIGLAVLGRDLGAILAGGDVAANLAKLGAASQAIQDYAKAQAAAEAAAEQARRDAAAKEAAAAAAAEAKRAWKAAFDLKVLLLKEGFAQLLQLLGPRSNQGNVNYGGPPDGEEPPDEEEPDTVDDKDGLFEGPGGTLMRAPDELVKRTDSAGEPTPVDPNPPRIDPGPAPEYGKGADDPKEVDLLELAGIVVCTPIRDATVIFKHNKDTLLASPLVSDMSVPESGSPVQFPAMNAYPTDHVQFGSTRLTGQEEDATAAVKVKLVEIETAAFDASNFLNGSGAPVFDRKKMCFTGRFTPWKATQGAATGDLPVHVFFDKGRTTPTFWYDGSLELPSVPLGSGKFPLLFRLKFIRPHSGQLGDLVGDEALFAPVNPLLETVREGCPVALRTNPESEVFLGGPIDGAKLEGWIKGILRTGTDASVAKTIQYELTPIVVPPTDGVDAAIFAAKYNSGNRYFGLDAGLRIPLPHWLWVDQPYLGVCGGGKQDVHTCMTQVPYNAEPRVEVVLGWNSDGPGFGHLHVLFMNDDPSAASEADLNVNRMTYDWDIPRAFRVDGWFKQRPRDGFVDVKLHLTQAQSLSDVVLAYWDPKKPARWGDASESSDPENNVPNYQLVMRDVPADFTATATIYAPKYGNRDPDNIYVTGHSMRDPDTLRGLIVHADLDLNQSSWLRVRLDSRKSRHDTGWKKGWGEDPAKNVIRASYEQEFKTDTSWVQAVYPGLHLSTAQQTAIFRAWSDDYVNGGLPVGGLTTFLDMDLGVRVTLKKVSSVGLQLDATHLTQSVKSSEFSAGGTAIVDFGEPLHVGGTWTWNEGAWYDDRYTNFTILGFPTTETGTGRDDVVLVNRQGNFWSSWKWMSCGNQLDMSDLGIIGWVQPVTTSGSVSYFHYNIGPMFSCTKWSNIFTGGLVNKFNKIVNAMNDASTVSATNGSWPLPDVLPRDTASPGNWGAWWYHTGGADYDNKITWNGPYPTSGGFLWMADGTYLRVATRHSQCGQLEVFLFGYYSNGQLRSVNRVGRIDKNFGSTLCRNTRWKIEVSPFVSSVSNRVQIRIRAQYDRKNVWGNWKNDWKWEGSLARTFTFDASGNGGQAPLTGTINPTPYSAVPGTTVSFNSGTSSYNLPCWFYPGDGSKPTKKSGSNPPFTHQYLFPSQHAWNPSGNHTAMHVCYGGTSPSSNNVAQGTYGFANAP